MLQISSKNIQLTYTLFPYRLGLGASIPTNFLQSTDPKARRLAVSANEALKRKIMGRGKSSSSQEASKPRPQTAKDQPNANDDDEAEEGRSSLGKPKRRKVTVEKNKEKEDTVYEDRVDSGMREGAGLDEGADKKSTKISPPSPARKTTKTSSKGPVRFGTYLDVHKAEKARKKKKKKA